ncbi:CDP-alcohol phosphatidyltransferase family protein [Alkalibaculum bacchi]|uniref:CDP-alcohol phosphatidyltransferase family protein n=1 Tax=Alkalibaculum bacchi TaxID=645887 RepID=UPI0024201151|nr:CDP-alcohol phosphatidyltransferase family protein [Alkalibaculum bacchi]
MITFLRIVFAVVMVLMKPFSPIFWLCYLGGGLSDMLDGFIARNLKLQSNFGAKLDSIADLIFAMAIFIVITININLPIWIWVCVILVAVIRIVSYCIGFYKYHTFSSLHTYLNKITGALIFMFPLLYVIFSIEFIGAIICVVAFVSSFEELLLTVKSKELNRDIKGVFCL